MYFKCKWNDETCNDRFGIRLVRGHYRNGRQRRTQMVIPIPSRWSNWFFFCCCITAGTFLKRLQPICAPRVMMNIWGKKNKHNTLIIAQIHLLGQQRFSQLSFKIVKTKQKKLIISGIMMKYYLNILYINIYTIRIVLNYECRIVKSK